MREFSVAGVTCRVNDEASKVSGHSAGGGLQDGWTLPATVTVPDGAVLEAGLTRWEDGSADLRVFTRLTGPAAYDRLVNRVRMSVFTADDEQWCELRILRHSDPLSLPTMTRASWEDLDTVSGVDTRAWLTAMPSVRVGTREELYGEANKRRHELALACDRDVLPLFAAYVLSRVLPTLKGFGGINLVPAGNA